MMKTNNATIALALISLALFLSMTTGCGVSVEGEEGNLRFHFQNSSSASSADTTDVAVGTKVDLEVSDVESDENEILELIEAYSDDAQTLEVTDQDDETFELTAIEASGPEGTTIHASAYDLDGNTLTDSISLRTAEVDGISAGPRCDDGMFLTDSGARFDYEMYDAQDEPLLGYGYYPVSVEPSDGGAIDDAHVVLQRLQLATGSLPGDYQLVSDLDDQALTDFTLLEATDLDEIELLFGDEDLDETLVDTVAVGSEMPVAIYELRHDGMQVCGSPEAIIDVDANNPDTCQPKSDFYDGSSQLLSVEGLEVGDCEITLSIPDAGLQETFHISIEAA